MPLGFAWCRLTRFGENRCPKVRAEEYGTSGHLGSRRVHLDKPRAGLVQADASNPALQDSVVAGDLHTGNVIHHHHYHAPAPAPASPPVVMMANPMQPVQQVFTTPPGSKDMLVAYLIWIFIGVFGGHRFYLNRPVSGIFFFLTFGFLGLGWLVDAALIPGMVEHCNLRARMRYHT